MRRYLAAALAFVGMIACNKTGSIVSLPKPEITFDDSFVEIKRRAAIDPSITTQTIDAFDVWGYIGEEKEFVFDGDRVTRSGSGWTYGEVKYWIGSQTYHFGAVAPVDHDNISVDTEGANEYGLGTVTFTNIDGSDDLLYASKTVTTEADVLNNDPGKVHLQFAHLLSKVKFTVTNGFATDNTSIVVKNIRMSVPKTGTINLAQSDWRTKEAWQVNERGLVLEFGDIEAGRKMKTTESAESDNERLTIPDETTYTITFDVAMYIGSYEVPAYQVTRTVEITQALKTGRNYNFKTTIGPENIDPAGPLKPIEFDVLEVKAWVENEINL